MIRSTTCWNAWLSKATGREWSYRRCTWTRNSLLAFSPIAQGRLSGKYSATNPPPSNRGFGRYPMEEIEPLLDVMRKIAEIEMCLWQQSDWTGSCAKKSSHYLVREMPTKLNRTHKLSDGDCLRRDWSAGRTFQDWINWFLAEWMNSISVSQGQTANQTASLL